MNRRNLIPTLLLTATALTGAVRAQETLRRGASNEQLIDDELRQAVARGHEWLASHQHRDGYWAELVGYKLNTSYEALDERPLPHVGVTSLALMSFLAGGHLPDRGKYGKVISNGLDFVLRSSQDDGQIMSNGTRMYSHAFATLFLAEVYGMVERDDVKRVLQRSVDLIVDSQNAEGGWRYGPQAQDSDMSIVVCQCLALRAARNIGIRVPKSTIDSAVLYVVDSAVKGQTFRRYNSPGTFTYQRDANSRTTFPLTAAGVTALNGLGIYSDELIDRGIEYLNDTFERFNYSYGRSGHYFFWYGHYYGVQAMYTKGGIDWVNYFERLRGFLLSTQRADGSWPNQIGPGTAFSTAMGCLILEIPYDFLPIFHR